MGIVMEAIERIYFDSLDDDLDFRVKTVLHACYFPSFRDLDIEVSQTSVVLRGQVNSYYEKQVALNACQRVAGKVNTVDRIEVRRNFAGSVSEPYSSSEARPARPIKPK